MKLKYLSDDWQYIKAGLKDAYHIVYYIPRNQSLTDWSKRYLYVKKK